MMIGAAILLLGSRRDRAQTLQNAFKQRWGVTVITSDLQREIAPLVATPSRPVQLSDLDPSADAVALNLLGKAFAVYPPGFVPRMLKTIAAASDVKVWNEEAGGFFHEAMIAVNFKGVEDPSTRGFDVDTVHHELSSIVKTQTTFDISAWERANPRDFTYMDLSGLKATLADAGSVEGDATLHEEGFVSRYGQTSLENDWNTYAERVFGHGADFASLLVKEPAMRPKARILMAVYESLDPRFHAYFERVGLSRAAS